MCTVCLFSSPPSLCLVHIYYFLVHFFSIHMEFKKEEKRTIEKSTTTSASEREKATS